MKTRTKTDLKSFVAPLETRMQYGVPELKKIYKKYLTRGLIISLILYFSLIGSYVAVNAYERKLDEEYKINRDLELSKYDPETDKTNDKSELTPPVEVAPVNDKGLKELEALTPEPVAKDKAEVETLKKIEDMERIKAFVSSEGDENYDPTKESQKVIIENKKIDENIKKDDHIVKPKPLDNEIYQVDKAPVAVNLSSVQGSMRYPEIARVNNTEGTVVARILVGPDGSVISIGSFSGPEVFRDEVSSKIINLQFTPALQQGQNVRCWVNVPFSFKLSNKFKKDDDNDKKEEKIKKDEQPKEIK